jgi:MFS family permease
MTQASISQVLVPLTTIGATFGVERDPGELSWTIAAFSLTVGIFVLPSGRLGDIYGHRKLLALGFAVLGLWSGIAGFSAFSRSVIFFDTCRALQGIGPAIMLPNALAILGRNYPTGTRKNLAFGAFAASAPNGFMVGALFASLLTTRLWWPWTFWIQAIASFLFAALVFYAIPPDELSQEEKAISFDWLGTAIALPGLILVNFAFNQAPLVGWSNPYIYILLIIGVLLLIGFFYVEGKVEDPLIPRSIWNLDVSIVLGALACGWAR